MKDFAPGEGLRQGAAAEADGLAGWVPVSAPGDVYDALHRAGRLPDPLGDRNEDACRWVAEREWWWRCRFQARPAAPRERLHLVFHGLDTFASIWLNGERIGQSDNMFTGLEIDITGRLLPGGDNTLAVCFDPVSLHVEGRDLPFWPGLAESLAGTKRNLVRKAQFGWGWDWGPRLPTVGIWRPVDLRRQSAAALADVSFRTLRLTSEEAVVRIGFEVERFAGDGPLAVTVTLADPSGAPAASASLSLAGGRHGLDLTVHDPAPWWTHDLGGQPLYRLEIVLAEGAAVLDSRALRVGLRVIELDTSPDPAEPGTRFFRFRLNGRPVFAKGACWIPASSLVGTLTREQYRPLLQAAAEANMNMLRVWGGGIYEHDAFYDLCDELGLLTWQDFMFACAPYPEDDPAFAASVEREVRYQIRRLRHHPSLALWCGNNENQFIQHFVDAVMGTPAPLPGALYYDRIMPAAVAELDPATPYWPGSPHGGGHANSMREGDLHDWTVWHGLAPVPDAVPQGLIDRSPEGVAYQRYAENQGRFISEFGIQASPGMETLRRCLPADQLALKSPGLENRIKDVPKDKVDAMLLPVTGLPQSLEDYVDFTMMTQAEGLKFGIEHFRRRKPHCSGTLVWQHNDCWPGISWSLIDFYGFPKAGYFYARRAFAPVLASFKALDDGAVELWITNDAAHAAAGTLSLRLLDFSDGPVWARTLAFDVPDNGNACIWRGSPDELRPSPGRVLTLQAAGGLFPPNRHFFAALKDLRRPAAAAPAVEIVQAAAGRLLIRLRAHDYLRFVHVLSARETVRFSDNYFDLAPGDSAEVTATAEGHDIGPQDVTVHFR